MSVRQRCDRSGAIVETLLAGEPLAATDRAHLDACATCARLAARVTTLEAGIARAAAALSADGPIPAGVLDADVVEAPIGRRGPRIGLRLASLTAAAGVGLLVTAIGLGFLRPDTVAPTPAAPDMSPAGIAARLASGGMDCAETTLEKHVTPPRVGYGCKPAPVAGVERMASVFETPSGETWLEAAAKVADRTDDAQVEPAIDFLLDAAAAGIPDAGQSITVRGYLGSWLSDRSRPRDQYMILGERLVELEGSWAQGFVLRIGPP